MIKTNKKINSSKKFVIELMEAEKNRDNLLIMARDVLRQSHTKRSYIERDIPESQVALNMKATYAIAGAIGGKDLSTDQRLILIKQRYQKQGFGDFDKDFKKTYPEEYGVKAATISPLIIQKARASSRTV